MQTYSLRQYESACINSNRAFQKALEGGFTQDSLSLLATAIRTEKTIRAYMDDDKMDAREAETIRRKYAKMPRTHRPKLAQPNLNL